VETDSDFQPLLDNGHEHIDGNGDLEKTNMPVYMRRLFAVKKSGKHCGEKIQPQINANERK